MFEVQQFGSEGFRLYGRGLLSGVGRYLRLGLQVCRGLGFRALGCRVLSFTPVQAVVGV